MCIDQNKNVRIDIKDSFFLESNLSVAVNPYSYANRDRY